MWLLIECGFIERIPESNLYSYPNVVGEQSMYDKGYLDLLVNLTVRKIKKLSNQSIERYVKRRTKFNR